MTPHEAARADFDECERLIREYLNSAERRALRIVRWDLDPPQREDYTSPLGYALGCRAYARRVLAGRAPTGAGR